MINLYKNTKVVPITQADLAKKISMLTPGEYLYFWSNQNEAGYSEEIHSVKFAEEFEAWMILINMLDGGTSTVIGYSPRGNRRNRIKATDGLPE